MSNVAAVVSAVARHPKTVMRGWRREFPDGGVPLPVDHDPVAIRHDRQLVVVLPHGTVWDEEYGQIARQLGAGRVQWGARPDGSPTRWHERAGHRSPDHWRHRRNYDHGDEPTLLCEDCAADLEMHPLTNRGVRTTDLELTDELEPVLDESGLPVLDEDRNQVMQHVWRAIIRPIPVDSRHNDGDPLDGTLVLEGGTVGGLRVAVGASDAWTEVALVPDRTTGGLLARLSFAPGRHRLRVQAWGAGVVDDVTLTLGRFRRVERQRRYHRVR